MCWLGLSVESIDYWRAVLNTVTILWAPYNAIMFSPVEDLSQGFVNPGRLVRCHLKYVGSNLVGT
jgi:hypothetical protein